MLIYDPSAKGALLDVFQFCSVCVQLGSRSVKSGRCSRNYHFSDPTHFHDFLDVRLQSTVRIVKQFSNVGIESKR